MSDDIEKIRNESELYLTGSLPPYRHEGEPTHQQCDKALQIWDNNIYTRRINALNARDNADM